MLKKRGLIGVICFSICLGVFSESVFAEAQGRKILKEIESGVSQRLDFKKTKSSSLLNPLFSIQNYLDEIKAFPIKNSTPVNISLEKSMDYALKYNHQIAEKKSKLESMVGEKKVLRSRFLPQLVFELSHRSSDSDKVSDDNDQGFALTQTLLEFGAERSSEVGYRNQLRSNLVDLEKTVRETLYSVRLHFFRVLLLKKQIATRRESLKRFETRHVDIQKKANEGIVLDVDVLTAKLNVLNEQLRLNDLNEDLARRKASFLVALGFPILGDQLTLSGEIESFDLGLKEAISAAMSHDTGVYIKRIQIAEQVRRLNELKLDYLPKVSFQTGYQGLKNGAALEIEGGGGDPYALKWIGEAKTQKSDSGFSFSEGPLATNDRGAFAELELSLPLFQGLKRRGERSREKKNLESLKHSLTYDLEKISLNVLQSYRTLVQRKERVRLKEQSVSISKKRLEVQEKLKEIAKVSDNELETFRNRYFGDIDSYFKAQADVVEASESLRKLTGYLRDSK